MGIGFLTYSSSYRKLIVVLTTQLMNYSYATDILWYEHLRLASRRLTCLLKRETSYLPSSLIYRFYLVKKLARLCPCSSKKNETLL